MTKVQNLMFVSMQIYEFLSKSQLEWIGNLFNADVCLYANIRIFKQITTGGRSRCANAGMFVSMQIYEFLSKSQPTPSTTTHTPQMFVSMQIYEFLSKSQPFSCPSSSKPGCLSLCKYTNF